MEKPYSTLVQSPHFNYSDMRLSAYMLIFTTNWFPPGPAISAVEFDFLWLIYFRFSVLILDPIMHSLPPRPLILCANASSISWLALGSVL